MAFEIVKLGTDKYTEVLADAHKSYNCSPNFAVRTNKRVQRGVEGTSIK